MEFGEIIGAVFTFLFFAWMAVYLGNFFHPSNRTPLTVVLVAVGMFLFLGAAAGVGAFLGFT